MLRLAGRRRCLTENLLQINQSTSGFPRPLTTTPFRQINHNRNRPHSHGPETQPSLSETPEKSQKPAEKINYNVNLYNTPPDPEHEQYLRVTANDLESYTTPPTRVKMLVRDFIEDSLYNPTYGYFPKQATIFEATGNKGPIDFTRLRDMAEFQAEVTRRYRGYGLDGSGPGRQIWHTPTELFKVTFFTFWISYC